MQEEFPQPLWVILDDILYIFPVLSRAEELFSLTMKEIIHKSS